MDYIVVTSESVLDGDELYTVEDERAEDERREFLVKEQDNILKENGYDILNTAYKIHFFNSAFSDDEYRLETIYDAIQLLAIKEGVDLVQYDNGNYGYVAYYGVEENGFEIMEPTTEEIFRYDEGDYDWANETYK